MGGRFRLWLRRTTAWLIVSGLVLIGGMVVSRARSIKLHAAGELTNEIPAVEQVDAGETVAAYKGFNYVETVAGQVMFALSSARTLGSASGWHEIKGVKLELYQRGKVGAVVTCDAAAFNIQTRDARLKGKIRLRFPNGATVTTERGHFEAGSRKLVTDSETTFMSDRAIGRADTARFVTTEDRLELEGRVEIRSGEGGSLSAPLVVYQRALGKVSMPEGCRLTFGLDSVEGAHATVQLEGREGLPYQIELEGGVFLAGGDGTVSLDGWAERLSAQRDAAGSWQFRASTTGPWVTLVARGIADVYERALRTWHLRGVAGSGGILTALAEGGVCLTDVPAEGGMRTAESSTAQVWFDGGQVSELELDDNVVMRGEGMTASGARARLVSKAGLVMLHSDPSGRQRAKLVTERGTVSADQVQLREAEGRAEGRGNVQGQLAGVALLGASRRQPGEPLHYASDGLLVSDRGHTFDLKGNARAWQGRRLLQSDQLHYQEREQRLRAVGHVRTIVPADELRPGEPAPGDAVIEARSLDYDATTRKAVYLGDVRYDDSVRTLHSAELDVLFDEKNEIATLEAMGGVEIVDLSTRRKMRGQTACRDVATRTVTLEGSPVEVSDDKGNAVSGTSLTWDETSGRVTVSGGPGSQTETIFRPEPTPAARAQTESGRRDGPKISRHHREGP